MCVASYPVAVCTDRGSARATAATRPQEERERPHQRTRYRPHTTPTHAGRQADRHAPTRGEHNPLYRLVTLRIEHSRCCTRLLPVLLRGLLLSTSPLSASLSSSSSSFAMSVSDVAPAVPARAAAVALTKSPSASSPKRSQSPALVEKSEDGRVESSAGEGRWIGAERPLLRTNEDDSATTRAARTSQSANNSPQHGSLQRLQELSGGGECSGGGSPMMSKNYLLQRRQVSDSGGLSAASARSSLLHTVASTSGTVSAADSSAIARPCSEGTDQPHALDAWSHLRDTLAGKHLVVFLDYDGTLTPIVSEPSAAIIDAPQRQRLAALAQQYPVAIVTGRKLDTITNVRNTNKIACAWLQQHACTYASASTGLFACACVFKIRMIASC